MGCGPNPGGGGVTGIACSTHIVWPWAFTPQETRIGPAWTVAPKGPTPDYMTEEVEVATWIQVEHE